MDIVDKLKAQAAEIADEGHNGWGNTMTEAAEKIESLIKKKAPVTEAPCSDRVIKSCPDKEQAVYMLVEKETGEIHDDVFFADEDRSMPIEKEWEWHKFKLTHLGAL